MTNGNIRASWPLHEVKFHFKNPASGEVGRIVLDENLSLGDLTIEKGTCLSSTTSSKRWNRSPLEFSITDTNGKHLKQDTATNIIWGSLRCTRHESLRIQFA